MQKLPLTLAIITKNEEQNIERCIRSVPFASDVVVLDSQSTDKTVEIAKKWGARCIIEPFRGYREQKQHATDLAAQDWVLSLDADEALSPSLQVEIYNTLQRIINGQISAQALQMPRLSFHLGRWIRYGGWYPDWQTRLFDRRKAKWQGGQVHEHVTAERIVRLKNHIEHFVFRDLAHQIQVNNHYSTLGALDLFEKGKKFSYFKLVIKPISKFFETYVWKMGFLDGLAGFIISVGAAYSVFLKFSKLYYLENPKK